MSDHSDTENYLRVTLDLMVKVADTEALQAAALADLGTRDLEDSERQEQHEQISSDPTGASALRWLISPDDVLGLVDQVGEIEPVEAILEISESGGTLEAGEA